MYHALGPGKSFGTQSPPLEATPGQEEPMGVSNIRGDKPAAVSDKEQRQEYFKDDQVNDRQPEEDVSEKSTAHPEKLKTD
ncbi:unnamed protein product [Somion occarium]|uniref:Uncharacterized protein n=1 Tax=Somion occarium TaxID=3059160 RepID=A0ABP1CXV5_9APHY